MCEHDNQTARSMCDGPMLHERRPLSLIVLIIDPEKIAPAYEEMARTVPDHFQFQNMAVRASALIRSR